VIDRSALQNPAAAMDRMYRRQRYIYDLTRRYYLLGRDRLITGLAAAPGMTVLEIGCGTARNLIEAARHYPDARCFGVDLSNQMLLTAHRNIARAGLTHRITIAQGDATNLDPLALFGRAQFERIFISYSLSIIPSWRVALDHALSLVAVQGELHIVDFGGQERLPRWFRAALRRWLALFDVDPRDDLAAQLGACAAAGAVSLHIARPYFGYAQHAVVTVLDKPTPSLDCFIAAPEPDRSAAA
jgi:S-adenosylmethionine-diacylgycerolhomoserine-N-methlytransferase